MSTWKIGVLTWLNTRRIRISSKWAFWYTENNLIISNVRNSTLRIKIYCPLDNTGRVDYQLGNRQSTTLDIAQLQLLQVDKSQELDQHFQKSSDKEENHHPERLKVWFLVGNKQDHIHVHIVNHIRKAGGARLEYWCRFTSVQVSKQVWALDSFIYWLIYHLNQCDFVCM